MQMTQFDFTDPVELGQSSICLENTFGVSPIKSHKPETLKNVPNSQGEHVFENPGEIKKRILSETPPRKSLGGSEGVKLWWSQMELKNSLDAELRFLFDLPFSVAKHRLGADNFFRALKEVYEKQGLSAKAIANLTGKAYSTVVLWLHLAEKSGYLTVRPRIKPFKLEVPVEGEIPEPTKKIIDGWEHHYLRIDENFSYFFGFYLGDGYTCGRAVHVMNTRFEMLPFIKKIADNIAEKIGVNTGVLYFDRKKQLVVKKHAYSWQVGIYSIGLKRAFISERGRKLLQNMMSGQYIYPCVAGFLDADGSVTSRGTIKFSQAENRRWILEEIRKGLTKNGIFCSEIYNDDKRAGKKVTIGERKVKANYDKYSFQILHNSGGTFAQRHKKHICHPKKREMLEKILINDAFAQNQKEGGK